MAARRGTRVRHETVDEGFTFDDSGPRMSLRPLGVATLAAETLARRIAAVADARAAL